MNSLVTGAAKWAYSQVGYDANPMSGETIPGGQYPVDITGRPPQGANVIGLNEQLMNDSSLRDFFRQSGPLSRFLNYVPGINAVAGIHDYWMNNVTTFSQWASIGTMLPAAAITYSALLNGSLSVQLSNKQH